ncbi:MAG TPA: hypothetical protein VFS90_15040 [Pyrinomonadaceae bacterium]|nr:hypothetical protein [Pyrinomonadaceae bacterium]
MSTALAKDPAVPTLDPSGTPLPQTLQTIMPAVVTPYTQTIVTDIDGDGLNEMIVFDNSLQQLAVVHQFEYTDFTLSEISSTVWPNSNSPIWTSDTSPHWMTTWASQQGAVPGGWTIGPGDAVIAADLDGDGILELFIYNLTFSKYGVLKWQTTTNQFQTVYKTNNVSNIGVFGSQYFVVPNVHAIVPTAPANAAGILYYNPTSSHMGMGMFYYSPGTGFVSCWTLAGSELPNNSWNLAANSPPANAFCPGIFAVTATPSVVVLDDQDQYIALLTWNGSAFLAPFGGQNPTAGNWRINAGDQMLAADLDGDGLTEILIYNPGTGFLGILKWSLASTNFESLVVTSGTITTGQYSFAINSNNSFYCLPGVAGAPARIVAYSSDPVNVALLSYQSGKFVCQWSGSSLSPNINGWPVSGKDSFYVGTPSATPPMFTISNQGASNAPVPTLGAVAISATGLQVTSDESIPIQSWSPAFVADAPKTAFTAFQTGDQPAIYTYISNLFPVPGQPGGPNQPIRTLYTNENYQGKFQAYAVALAGVPTPSQIPSTWPAHPTTWSTSDWATVVTTIVKECNQVDTVYSFYADLGGFASILNAFQMSDFNMVRQNIQGITPATPPTFSYWEGQAIVGSIWVMAAATAFIDQKAVAGSLNVIFTLMGSIASAAFGYNPTEEESLAFDEVEHALTETLAASFVEESLDLTAFLGDPVKLNILDGLSGNEWQMLTSLPSSMQGPFQQQDRLAMYEQLVPAYLTIVTTAQTQSSPAPLYYSNGISYNFNNPLTRDAFKASAFYKDLFHTLGVSEEAFFSGLGAWAAIPRTTD